MAKKNKNNLLVVFLLFIVIILILFYLHPLLSTTNKDFSLNIKETISSEEESDILVLNQNLVTSPHSNKPYGYENLKLLESYDIESSNNFFDFILNKNTVEFLPYNSLEKLKSINVNKSNVVKNIVEEEFTVIVTTHSRGDDLERTLKHFNSLPLINQVIIIWNNESPPSLEFINSWPKHLKYSHKIFFNGKNSLNNRFLPFEIIKTEAVLSMDDDILISHENILFAFNVWKQFRTRIVGFPGRGVDWNAQKKRWTYSAHPCSVSLVLTGCAFIHKKYFSIYTHLMPKQIRDEVDNKTNCEDIAMNFLVSHITKKAPIKVTPTNDLCPNCKEDKSKALWRDPNHFKERDDCLNSFSEIFGYMPLFSSEFRADDMFPSNDFNHCARIESKSGSSLGGRLSKNFISLSLSRLHSFLFL